MGCTIVTLAVFAVIYVLIYSITAKIADLFVQTVCKGIKDLGGSLFVMKIKEQFTSYFLPSPF